MAIETVTELVVDVNTKAEVYQEVEKEMPNPRIGEIQNRLPKIRAELQETDYKVLKYLTGKMTEEEYAPIDAERDALRAEYNELEAELATL